jgi:hypothetical protein
MYPTFPHPAVTPTMLRVAMSRWLNQNRATISAIRSVNRAPLTKAPMKGQLKILSMGARAVITKRDKTRSG